MSPEQISALRKELNCTARELGAALAVDQQTIFAWERGDLFPTKRYVDQMEELRKKGPSAIVRSRNPKNSRPPPMQGLADPSLWQLVRKLLVHPELFAAVSKLAADYEDPADTP